MSRSYSKNKLLWINSRSIHLLAFFLQRNFKFRAYVKKEGMAINPHPQYSKLNIHIQKALWNNH